ncbi:hypothetical protein NKG94_02955 [Micromonospora sp. M12]
MLQLSHDRSAGAHPYFVPAEHTAEARAAIGPDRLLAPRSRWSSTRTPPPRVPPHASTRAGTSRCRTTRTTCGGSAGPTRTSPGRSDRLVDALIPWGTVETVAAGLEKHYQAGADEVAIQVLNGGDDSSFPADEFRALAAVLI